uniref:Uncharacterized protein n=1 Tax=viral metagenome TaxID=1070528 RepID=A0A6C0BNU5_9ZZZZ
MDSELLALSYTGMGPRSCYYMGQQQICQAKYQQPCTIYNYNTPCNLEDSMKATAQKRGKVWGKKPIKKKKKKMASTKKTMKNTAKSKLLSFLWL